MKILLIALIVVLVSFANPASADPAFDKQTNVVKFIVKDNKSGRTDSVSFQKPATTILKPCANDQRRSCLFQIQGGKEVPAFDYTDKNKNMESYDLTIVYIFQTTIQTY